MLKINLINRKKCIKCHQTKIIKEFHKNKRMKDGYHYYCSDCAKKERKKRYKKNKKELNRLQKNYHNKIKQEFLSGERKQAKKKICPKCKRRKKADKFAKDYRNPTGLYVYCNECKKKYWREKRGFKKRNYSDKRFLRKLERQNKTIREAMIECNCSYETIHTYAKKFGIKFKNGNTKNPEDCSPYYHRKGYHQNGRTRNKKSQKATNKLHKEIEKGNIQRPLCCQLCGKNESTISGHHFDYSKPLQIIWVCPSCHRLIHKNKLEEIPNIKILREKLIRR